MKTLEFRGGALWLVDQTELPLNPVLIECKSYEDVAAAIRRLSIRGAPAIGLAAAYGMALAARNAAANGENVDDFDRELTLAYDTLRATRPTAVNLFWALNRMKRIREEHESKPPRHIAELLLCAANEMLLEDEAINRRMGGYGASLIPDGANVLTHCNAGALATGAYGTALGAIFSAHQQGKRLHVWVDETRPLLQGARLTAWELSQAKIPFTLITDNMAGHFMARGQVDLAITGADRVAANGDVANKIGTYTVATLARAHDLPFYVVAPTSTVDLATRSGEGIAIEERAAEEVAAFRGMRVAPFGAQVANPAFDVTPARLVTAIVTENGIVRNPFEEGLAHTAAAMSSAPAMHR